MYLLLSLLLMLGSTQSCNTSTPKTMTNDPEKAKTVYDFTMTTLDGKTQSLADYKGKVIIMVNVASRCGYTPQYADLEKFYNEYKDQGVVVLGFPANNFMGQEPGSNEEIATFCQKNYGVTFPMFAKISVKGHDIDPLYAYLTKTLGEDISWNFNKILIDKNGKPVQHFKSGVLPASPEFVEAVKKLL